MSKRVLIAGIGNIFLGDDGFGVEVVKRLAGRGLPEGVEVKDFGIRGMDLAYALQDDYALVIFVDATPRGGEPGTVYLIEPEIEEDGEVSLDTHGMDPLKVIKLSRALGAEPTRTLVVGCEPRVAWTAPSGAVNSSRAAYKTASSAGRTWSTLPCRADRRPSANPGAWR